MARAVRATELGMLESYDHTTAVGLREGSV
jgi:hypothetical protein